MIYWKLHIYIFSSAFIKALTEALNNQYVSSCVYHCWQKLIAINKVTK